MKTFNYTILNQKKWDNEIIGYVAKIHEYRAKQDIFLKQKPAYFTKLVELAKVQSTQASNEIEGIRTTITRLKQIITQSTTPKNRAEEEIAGYRDVLNLIHDNYQFIQLNPNFILQLHKVLYQHSPKSIGGVFKNTQNYISNTDEFGNISTIFTPLTPFETPTAIQAICDQFNLAISQNETDPLILISTFIHDFLCIHPFLDGNGRMSRLLTTLLLYKSGYLVGKYISIEAKIANTKDWYYDSLLQSGHGWHDNLQNNETFIKYLLSTILSAYRDFEERYNISDSNTALQTITKAIDSILGKFTKTDLVSLGPSLSEKTIESVLKKLLDSGSIQKYGAGKSTYYTKNN